VTQAPTLNWAGVLCLVLRLGALLVLSRVGGHLFVVPLESSQVLTRLREFPFLHALADVPVDKSALGVHEVEFVGESGPGFCDGRGVGKHAPRTNQLDLDDIPSENLHGTVDFGEIAIGHHLWWLVADTDLETSRAPIDELDGALGFESSNGNVHVLGNHIATV